MHLNSGDDYYFVFQRTQNVAAKRGEGVLTCPCFQELQEKWRHFENLDSSGGFHVVGEVIN